jgi:hypothetical protein
MVLKLESKRYADLASSTYRYLFKFNLVFPGTRCLIREPFPSTASRRLKSEPLGLSNTQAPKI